MAVAAAVEAPERGPRLVALAHRIDTLMLEFAVEAAAFAATDEYLEYGSATAIDWIRHNCHMSGWIAANGVCVGANLGRLPESVARVETSELGFAHLMVLARTADAVGDAFDEHELLAMALENSPGKLHRLCRHYRHSRNRQGLVDEEAAIREERYLKLKQWDDGAVGLSGQLDAVGGAALRSALEPLAHKLGAEDGRTLPQRMADALVELASGGEVKASIQVTASVETLAGRDGSPGAELELAGAITSQSLEKLACDCSITRVLLDADSQVIDVGRARRVPSAPVRRALNARDRSCRWPNCDRPARWCASHHILHWARGGSSDPPNLVLLCHRHHSLVHEGGWQLVKSDDGAMLTIAPKATFGAPARGPD